MAEPDRVRNSSSLPARPAVLGPLLRAGGRRRPRLGRMPRPLGLRRFERRYAARIGATLTPLAELIRARVVPVLPALFEEARAAGLRTDDPSETIRRIFAEIEVRYAEVVPAARVERETRQLALELDDASREHLRETFQRVLGIDPIASDPWLELDDASREHLRETFQRVLGMVITLMATWESPKTKAAIPFFLADKE